jgi:branched-chain amino acid transport system ATP-binding protein
MLLELDNITLLYGRIQALHGISLQVDEGEIVALIGANGAGKSTTMRAISGLRPVASGSIRFNGEDITRLRADLRVVRGLCQSPEGRGIFPGMTVLENLDMGAYTRRDRAGIAADLERVLTLFPRLAERAKQPAGAEADPADLRDHHRDQPAGHHHPPGRTERTTGAITRTPRVRAGDREHRALRHRYGAAP